MSDTAIASDANYRTHFLSRSTGKLLLVDWEKLESRILQNQEWREYSERKDGEADEYDKLRGGRRPMTVGELLETLKDMPPDAEVKIGHSPAHQRVGTFDPLVWLSSSVAGVDDIVNGRPVLGLIKRPDGTPLRYLMLE